MAKQKGWQVMVMNPADPVGIPRPGNTPLTVSVGTSAQKFFKLVNCLKCLPWSEFIRIDPGKIIA